MNSPIEAQPVIDGWFTTGPEPRLIGTRCASCKTVFFPKTTGLCRNPACTSRDLADEELSRTGTVWSYTDARYQPPPPYIPADPYEPFVIAAVELAEEKLVILGQLAAGFGTGDIKVGSGVELVVEPLYELDGVQRLVWRWKPLSAPEEGTDDGDVS